MSETKIINVAFGKSRDATTSARYRYDYGQVIEVVGINLPETFEARFSNSSHGESIRVIGTQNKVDVPDGLFLTGEPIYCYITVHDEDTDGRTMYSIKIPVKDSTERTDADPTLVEQDVITQAIASLNNAINRTTENVEITNTNVELAQESAVNAQSYAESANSYAENAQTSANSANAYAENANNSATNAEESAVRASDSETHVGQMVTEVEQITQRAETASINAESSASIATQKATEASTNANIATTKANEASTSATNAQNSANNAQQSATDAQESANSASASASRASVNAEKTQSDKEIVELAKSNVLSAVGEAQTYATTAQSASQAIQDMNVQATTLDVDSDVTVEKSVDPVTGAVTLTYGIPKGVKGEKGDTGSKGDKGDPFVYSDFTPEQLASLKGEKGDKGDTGASGKDGADGKDGKDGTDGISPTISITTITGGHRITITDANGQHSADVMDGDDYVLTSKDKADIAGLVDVPFRTIKEITITEETKTVYVGSDSDNEPFSLSEMIVIMQAVANNNGAGFFVINNGNVKLTSEELTTKPFASEANIFYTTERAHLIHMWIAGNRFFGETMDNTGNGYTRVSKYATRQSMGFCECDSITELFIYSPNDYKFTSGTITIIGR